MLFKILSVIKANFHSAYDLKTKLPYFIKNKSICQTLSTGSKYAHILNDYSKILINKADLVFLFGSLCFMNSLLTSGQVALPKLILCGRKRKYLRLSISFRCIMRIRFF